ncbi:hypothetical protein I6A84_26630 [Frankia sp. CNm7]|uniref:Uncharacterized protein n=1 Tax=Frankia nepalensis TaxID=1836974 RepID=A0A937R7K1_9ACTN|nr:DUF6529 family protein [Frankia nepalensis]MBL7497113.1 hypothetical protein [Frankia nepalensis]MBL7510785.1 hypothetical protein [Frankia nepalensis]MBL7521561.1 hypothetical protein [Frankia nepalensis]MBL7626796.1 hypothetical protein [Frankia nepalensis]
MSMPGPAAGPAAPPRRALASGATGLAGALLVGAAVAVALGVYGQAHEPARRPIYTLGFSSPLPMKAWLTTAVIVFVIIQLLTALWMWGRLPGAGSAGPGVAIVHRWSGAAAFVISLPVAFHCLWALGFQTAETRVLVHSLAGCVFYGAYAAKMLGLRVKNLPGWALPVLGGLVFTTLVVLWLTASLWFFTQSGIPHV